MTTLGAVKAPFKWISSKPYTVNLVILASFILLGAMTMGTLFGPRGVPGGDDWYIIANSATGQFPACTGIANFVNPWRPFHPTLHCLLYTLAGPNLFVLFAANALIAAGTAFAWYGIARNIFAIPRWFAFAIGIIALTYPDFLGQLRMTSGISLLGLMTVFYGIWFVLSYQDRPEQRWRLIAGCVLTLCGLLIYEGMFAIWAIGLPLAMLYKSHRFSRHWFLTTVVVELVVIGYLGWRFVILPKTYTDKTVIADHPLQFNLGDVIGQIRDSFWLVGYAWARNIQWLGSQIAANDQANLLSILAASFGIAAVILIALFIVFRADLPTLKIAPRRGLILLASTFLIIFLMGLPFYIVPLSFLTDPDHTFGTPLAAALGIVGLLWLLQRKRLVVAATTVMLAGLVAFSGVFSGYNTLEAQTQTRYACDFFLRFTDVVERVPKNIYVIVTAPRDLVLPDYFNDGYRFDNEYGMLYYTGPRDPALYDVTHFGYMGYLILADSWAELTDHGVQVYWTPRVKDFYHSRSPLPKLAPLDQTILVRYLPFRSLTILSAPQSIPGLVIRPEGGAQSQASTLARRFCDWDATGRQTMQQLEVARQSHPTAAAVCHDEGVTVYGIKGEERTPLFTLTKAELDQLPQKPPTNTVIAQGSDVRLYRLTSGELQINAPPGTSDQLEYVFIWDGCSR